MKHRLKSVVAGLALATACVALPKGLPASPPASAEIVSFSGLTMGTAYSAKLVVTSEGAESLQPQVDERLAEINARMSTYDPESELSRFNASDSLDWFPVSGETARVVAYALQVAESTRGQFDPTVGPVVNLWGFGPDGRRTEPPTDEQVDAALARVGYRAVEAREDPPALRKSRPDVYLDLSAIAKGYGVDAVSELLANLGAKASMVEIGGEVVCRGKKPDGSSWRIGVEKPDEGGRALQVVVQLDDRAIATSGDYRNFFQDDDQRFSHTIDPTTGRPVTHRLATVSVQAPTCMRADALATGLLVMGPDDGYNWAEEHGVAAMFIRRVDGRFEEQTTSGWREPPAPGESQTLATILITIAAFAIALAGMAIGVILSNRRIKGSCGGLAGFKDREGNSICEACTNPSPECRGERAKGPHSDATQPPASASS